VPQRRPLPSLSEALLASAAATSRCQQVANAGEALRWAGLLRVLSCLPLLRKLRARVLL